jgi:glycosyltransferase involved in cell wall biosynthesis
VRALLIALPAAAVVLWAPSFVAEIYDGDGFAGKPGPDYLTRPDQGWRFLAGAVRLSRGAALGTATDALEQAKDVWAGPPAVADDVRLVSGDDPFRVAIVPPGVDLERFHVGDRAASRASLGIPPEAFLAVSVRRLDARMGLDVLLDAWGKVAAARNGAVLLVAGEGEERSHLEELRGRLSEASFRNWVVPARPVGFASGRLVIAASSSFARDWLEERLAGEIARAIAQVSGSWHDLRFVARDGD